MLQLPGCGLPPYHHATLLACQLSLTFVDRYIPAIPACTPSSSSCVSGFQVRVTAGYDSHIGDSIGNACMGLGRSDLYNKNHVNLGRKGGKEFPLCTHTQHSTLLAPSARFIICPLPAISLLVTISRRLPAYRLCRSLRVRPLRSLYLNTPNSQMLALLPPLLSCCLSPSLPSPPTRARTPRYSSAPSARPYSSPLSSCAARRAAFR